MGILTSATLVPSINKAFSADEIAGVRAEKARSPVRVLTEVESFRNPASLMDEYVVRSVCDNHMSRLGFKVNDEIPREVISEMIVALARWTSTHV